MHDHDIAGAVDSAGGGRRPRWRRPLAVIVAVPLVVLPAVGVLGALFYRLPYLGAAAGFVPPLGPWVAVLALVGSALCGWCWPGGRVRVALLVLGLLTALGSSVVVTRMITTVDRAGADINVWRTFDIAQQDAVAPDVDVSYTTFEGRPLRLSVYRPAGRNAPVLIQLHGGGWREGSRNDRRADLRWFADQGWLTISVDYSLSDDQHHLWSVTESQIGCALAWAGAHARQYGGDPSRLSLSGDSAGGNLAINAAYRSDARTLPSACGGQVPPVRAVSAFYPVVDVVGLYRNDDALQGAKARGYATAYTGGSPERFPDRYRAISSATHLSPTAPPTQVVVGAADHFVRPEGSYEFVEQARAIGVDVALVRVPYAEHLFDRIAPGTVGQQAYRQLTLSWLRLHG